MKKVTIIIGGAVVLCVLGLVVLFLEQDHGPTTGFGREASGNSATAFAFVCIVTVSLPETGGRAKDPFSEVIVGGIDLDTQAGWYRGQFALSEERKGTLHVDGSRLKVGRPSMFPRFGAMVIGEEFTLDRETGEFRQWLSFQDGRRISLMSGYCGKYVKAPF